MIDTYITEGIEMEFFTLDEAIPEEREMVILVLKPKTLGMYRESVAENSAGNLIISASTRVFKKVPPKFTVRTHYSTYDITSEDVIYWGRIKKS